MINESELFIEGERRLGLYTVELLRKASTGWATNALPLFALVSNYRLILKPLKKKYPAASIPSTYVRLVEKIVLEPHRCIAVRFKDGGSLFLVVLSGSFDHLAEDLSAMKAPPPRFSFDNTIPLAKIHKLISYFTDGLPPHGEIEL